MTENNYANYNNSTQPPPPAYQNGTTGQTYYQPPPPPTDYAPPPPTNNHPNGIGQRFTQFYAPPQNKKLGMKRRFCSFICCCIIIGLIVGLAAGLTRRSYYYGGNSNCNCRTNSDCTTVYG
ncbi:hypothetical protein [Parasitella parasitica]|uniref:Uncharacterized protein n=1 Tax=Parasitella parasitica TaxID=35722 RepID=A0A0B7NUG2_9FUNG|nr:hypothetical protein [Parasitella parasitica]